MWVYNDTGVHIRMELFGCGTIDVPPWGEAEIPDAAWPYLQSRAAWGGGNCPLVPMVVCPQCGKAFRSNELLELHWKRAEHEGRPWIAQGEEKKGGQKRVQDIHAGSNDSASRRKNHKR